LASVIHIVDDDASVRAATSFLLRSHGYATQIYSSGVELLETARLLRGCILLDLRMPEMDGFAVQAELARRDSDLAVILMTGHGDIPSAVRALKLGATDFVEKPFEETALIQSVEQALAVADVRRHSRGRRHRAIAAISLLSAREKQILRGLLAGMTNKEIARRFEISPRTVEMHRANMMRDMSCNSLSDVIRIGVEAELEPLSRLDAQPELNLLSIEGLAA
jgi:two-component system response regulator FixJ